MAARNRSIGERLEGLVEYDLNGGCWLWRGTVNDKGYGRIAAGRGKCVAAHRIAYETWCGPIAAGLIVRHRCDIPGCINPAHLELGVHRDNVRDAVERNRFARGRRVATAKLDEGLVREIRALRQKGHVWAKIHARLSAEGIEVCLTTVRYAADGTTWGHLPSAAPARDLIEAHADGECPDIEELEEG